MRSFSKTYKLPSDYIKEEYDEEKEKTNLQVYQTVIEFLNEEYPLNEKSELSFDEFMTELLSLCDLIDYAEKYKHRYVMINLASLMTSLSFRYLNTNYFSTTPAEYLIEKLYRVYEDKNKDYNNSAEKQLMMEGTKSFKIRIQDKVSRLYSFCYNEEMCVEDEKIEDTLMDLINYCIIFLIWALKDKDEVI